MRGPAVASKCVGNYIDIKMPPRPLVSVLIEIMDDCGWLSPGEVAEELAEEWLKTFKARIRATIKDAHAGSKFLTYEINYANDDFIQGSCFIERTDDADVIEAKNTRANTYFYTEKFKKLVPKEFEILCGRILSLFKVEKEFVTRASADQGIDFFGLVPFGQILKPSAITPGAEKQLKIWLVGQAKHYNAAQVSTKDIRELVGSISLAKSKVYAGAKDPLANLLMRTCDPVFFLFFTTGRITRDAMDLLARSGVVAMDGNQLAMFLADHGIGINAEKFDTAAFDAWLRG